MSNPATVESNLETRADLGLTLQIFEPFHNLSVESRAKFATESPTPFYHSGPARLYQGDALELLARAKSETFDLIFADPPYFLSGGGITCQNGQMVSVNKGDWDKAVTPEEIHAFNMRWLRECHRLLKPDGTIWISGTSHNIYSVGFALQSLGYKVLNDIAWHKTNPPPHLACRYFTHAHETLLWARKSPKAKHYFDYPAMKADNGDKQMQSVWKLPAPSKWEKRFGKHPTQKPEILLDRIIRASSKPNDLILDPFCGSATTGVVASRLKRRFVGFEIEDEYLQLGEKRMSEEIELQKINALYLSNENVTGGGGGGGKCYLICSYLTSGFATPGASILKPFFPQVWRSKNDDQSGMGTIGKKTRLFSSSQSYICHSN